MKKLITLLLPIVCFACHTTSNNYHASNTNSTEQVFIDGPGGLPGKCYSKMKLQNELVFTEILCHPQITKKVIAQIQTDLVRLNYTIDENEIAKSQFGETTKAGIKDFQIKNDMAYGNLDWATINRLNLKEGSVTN